MLPFQKWDLSFSFHNYFRNYNGAYLIYQRLALIDVFTLFLNNKDLITAVFIVYTYMYTLKEYRYLTYM